MEKSYIIFQVNYTLGDKYSINPCFCINVLAISIHFFQEEMINMELLANSKWVEIRKISFLSCFVYGYVLYKNISDKSPLIKLGPKRAPPHFSVLCIPLLIISCHPDICSSSIGNSIKAMAWMYSVKLIYYNMLDLGWPGNPTSNM